jgi:hypothetical protein
MTETPGRSGVAAGESPAAPGLLYCPFNLNYGRGCRCDACRYKQAKAQAKYRRRLAEKQYGATHPNDRMPIELPLKAITRAHNDLGITFAEIGRVSGVTKDAVRAIYHQRVDFVQRRNHDRILAAYPLDSTAHRRAMDDRQLVNWSEHRWKLYGLLAQGWTAATLKEILKADNRQHGWIDHFNERERIQYRTLKQLDWLVEKIGDRQGPSNINRLAMQRKGIFPLIHYTENGRLIRQSLRPEHKEALGRVPSKHGAPTGRRHGTGSRP